ncbi:MAG: hypothetical protein ACD_78C00260G0001, partial [uncultured bacterium (gcode 4)]
MGGLLCLKSSSLRPLKIFPVYLPFLHTFLTIHREDMDSTG